MLKKTDSRSGKDWTCMKDSHCKSKTRLAGKSEESSGHTAAAPLSKTIRNDGQRPTAKCLRAQNETQTPLKKSQETSEPCPHPSNAETTTRCNASPRPPARLPPGSQPPKIKPQNTKLPVANPPPSRPPRGAQKQSSSAENNAGVTESSWGTMSTMSSLAKPPRS